MNLIFLDIKGVLATGSAKKKLSERTGKPQNEDELVFDAVCMYNLLCIVKQTHSKIIITSEWRREDGDYLALLSKLRTFGLDEYVIGVTPSYDGLCGEEIKECLKKHPGVRYVILDDNPKNMDEFSEYLVVTDFQTGLTISKSDEVIIKLTR